jgi:hypothetical protein
MDFAARTLRVQETWDNELKVIQLNQTLQEVLQRVIRQLHSAFAFCNVQGNPCDEPRCCLRMVCREADTRSFCFHDLWHASPSHLVMNKLKTMEPLLGYQDYSSPGATDSCQASLRR